MIDSIEVSRAWPPTADWALVYVTLVLVGVTAALALYTARLWRSTKKLAADANDTATEQARLTRDAIRQATRSADHAEASVVASLESSERQLRGYVEIRPDLVETKRINAEQILFRFLARVVNRGQTPAYHMRTAAHVAELPVPFPLHPPGLNEEESSGYFAPRAEFVITPDPHILNVSELPAVREGKARRLYFYGYILYEDAFRKRWRQRFAVFVRFDGPNDKVNLDIVEGWNHEASVGGQETPIEDG